MNKYALVLVIILFTIFLIGCPGVGKVDKEAAETAIAQIKEKYPEEVVEVKVYRDKLQIALKGDISPVMKSQVFMDAARIWWMVYPKDKQPRHKLYCWAYDDVISDDDIGSLTMQKGVADYPRVTGEPGIYSLRDVK